MADVYAHLKVAAVTDQGRKRKNNEDAYGSYPKSGVFCVADGMGGAEDGEVASHAVVDAVTATLDGFARAPQPLSLQTMQVCIDRAVNEAAAWIFKRSTERGTSGTGTTFVGVCFDPERPEAPLALHAGDSRLYRLRGASISQITMDHSAAALAGVKDEMELNPIFRGVVMRAVGVRDKVELESTSFDVREGDHVLLCSDGLTRMLSDEEILEIVSKASGVQSIAQALVDRANARGGIDNVTVILIGVGALPEPVVGLPLAELKMNVNAAYGGNEPLAVNGQEEACVDETRSLPSDVRTPSTPSWGSGQGATLFSSDSDEVLVARPHNASVPEKPVDKPPAPSHISSPPAPMLQEPIEKRVSKRRTTRVVVSGLALCFLSGGILVAQLREKPTTTGALVKTPDVNSQAQGIAEKTKEKEEQDKIAAAALAAKQKEAQAKIAEAALAKQKEEEAKIAEAALAAKQAEEEAKIAAAALAKQKEEEAKIDASALAKQKEAQAKIAAAALAKQKDAEAKIAAAALAEEKRKQDKIAAELAAKQKEQDAEAKRVAAPLAEEKALSDLSKDTEVLSSYARVVGILNNADSKKATQDVLQKAKDLANMTGASVTTIEKEKALSAFASALPMGELLHFSLEEWKKRIESFQLSKRISNKEHDKAIDIIGEWEICISGINQPGDPISVRRRLVERVRKISEGMKKLLSINPRLDPSSVT